MTRVLLSAAILLGSAALAMAEGERCYVTDPTGTPLNVRASPNGAIIGTLKNGKFVRIVERANAANPGLWSSISRPSSGSAGFSIATSPALEEQPAQQIPLASRRIIPIVQRSRAP
jgi:hypothetical protein